jgi:hypothetical protein
MKLLKGMKDEISVKVEAQLDDNYGKKETVGINLTFKKINNVNELQTILENIRAGSLDEVDALGKYLVKWDLEYADGEAVPLDPDTISAVYAIGPYRTALSSGFLRAQYGYAEEQKKN